MADHFMFRTVALVLPPATQTGSNRQTGYNRAGCYCMSGKAQKTSSESKTPVMSKWNYCTVQYCFPKFWELIWELVQYLHTLFLVFTHLARIFIVHIYM